VAYTYSYAISAWSRIGKLLYGKNLWQWPVFPPCHLPARSGDQPEPPIISYVLLITFYALQRTNRVNVDDPVWGNIEVFEEADGVGGADDDLPVFSAPPYKRTPDTAQARWVRVIVPSG